MSAKLEIVVTGHNVHVSDRHRSYVSGKLADLDHYDNHVIRYDVGLNQELNPRQSKSALQVAITGHGKGSTVRAEARGSDLRTVIDAAVGRLEGQLRRTHDRREVHHYR